jgi:hypothetical protein
VVALEAAASIYANEAVACDRDGDGLVTATVVGELDRGALASDAAAPRMDGDLLRLKMAILAADALAFGGEAAVLEAEARSSTSCRPPINSYEGASSPGTRSTLVGVRADL